MSYEEEDTCLRTEAGRPPQPDARGKSRHVAKRNARPGRCGKGPRGTRDEPTFRFPEIRQKHVSNTLATHYTRVATYLSVSQFYRALNTPDHIHCPGRVGDIAAGGGRGGGGGGHVAAHPYQVSSPVESVIGKGFARLLCVSVVPAEHHIPRLN